MPAFTHCTDLGYFPTMSITVRIPDDFARQLSSAGGDIERMALEALALEEYRAGRQSRPDLRRLLGFDTRGELDGFLKTHGINEGMNLAEFEQDRRDLDRLGL